jgi:hypothetical protein
VIDVKTHQILATVKQASPFSPNIAATPDGKQVWFTLKDTGKTQVILKASLCRSNWNNSTFYCNFWQRVSRLLAEPRCFFVTAKVAECFHEPSRFRKSSGAQHRHHRNFG